MKQILALKKLRNARCEQYLLIIITCVLNEKSYSLDSIGLDIVIELGSDLGWILNLCLIFLIDLNCSVITFILVSLCYWEKWEWLQTSIWVWINGLPVFLPGDRMMSPTPCTPSASTLLLYWVSVWLEWFLVCPWWFWLNWISITPSLSWFGCFPTDTEMTITFKS